MLKKIAFGSVGILFLVAPLLTHATSPVLCADGQTAPNHSDGRCPEWTDDYGTSSGGYCPDLSITFSRGATDARTNGQVSELQRFLTDYYDINQNIVVGVFGPVTQRYVIRFQREQGLPTFGIVGSMTRARIASVCGGSQYFSASPTSGAAPLAVTFSTNISGQGGQEYTIEYGDGSSAKANYCYSPLDLCQQPGINTHTYTTAGTFTAILKRVVGVREVQSGDTNIYEVVGTVTITVGGTGAGAPSINGIDAPATLSVGQTGTWTVHASVPNGPNTQLRYSVIWGDEGVYDQIREYANGGAATLQTSAIFTHTYATAGTYRPTFTVSNDAGSAQTSASIVVGKDTSQLNCPQYMAPLCSANETLVGGGYGTDGCQLSPRCVSNTTGTTVSSGSLSASPASGDAPLTVTFSGVGSNLSFGDDGPVLIADGGTTLGTVTHLYLSSGTYTATSDGKSVNIKVNARKGTTREELFAPSSCVYNNRTYVSGTSADVPTKTCTMRGTSFYGALCEKLALMGIQASVTPQRYTCQSGQWIDSNNIPFEGDLLGATSCMASGGMTVANGQLIVQGSSAAAWMFDQQNNTYAKRIPTMKCDNGTWLDCDAYGKNCT